MSRPARIVSIVGARPQFVKAAVVSKALAEAGMDEILVHTGQHYDAKMSDIFFDELGIPAPGHHLEIGSSSHGAQTGRMLEAVEQVILDERPDRVLVYGDTNSTVAGALAASKLQVPIDHVEAGLRSFNRRMPEEVNRVVTDHLSDLLFAPTETAIRNLANEGIRDGVHRTGDVMFDATLAATKIADERSDVRKRVGVDPGGYVLATIHRPASTDAHETLKRIIDGLQRVAGELPVILPLHPRTRAALDRFGLLESAAAGLRLIDPVGYLDMTSLEAGAAVIATDSGGVQKEAFFHGVPCVTMRSETEWVELVELGWNTLVDPDTTDPGKVILSRIGQTGRVGTPYGDGHAADAIAGVIASSLDE
ncbi:MAG: UDP-N-acetylglucosamine 2-epimerase (non-hydrolyzing) [Actinomycetales bacterium]|nr:UDP-N-acetylglucosamine 2-epimerase (non-hydrolyzing) [Actinomycetales bacterium]